MNWRRNMYALLVTRNNDRMPFLVVFLHCQGICLPDDFSLQRASIDIHDI